MRWHAGILPYCMRAIASSLKGCHAVYARKDCASTLVAVRVEFLLGEDVATGLSEGGQYWSDRVCRAAC